MPAAGAPLFSFGVIADAQYADLPDGNTEGRRQAYREVPAKLRAALAALRGFGHGAAAGSSGGDAGGDAHPPQQQLQQQLQQHEQPLGCVVHLGDIINGNPAGADAAAAEFDLVARIFEEELGEELPAVHVIGNHCLSVPRAVLLQRLHIPGSCYYTCSMAPGWRLVVLDTTEMSGHSDYPKGSEQQREAQEFLAAHPLSEGDPQMSKWNGGVTQRQLAWLREQLAAAGAAGERVLVASHHQVGCGGARATHMAWNWRQVQEVLLASPAFRAAFAGHDHVGGYACIEGRHFLTLQGLLEAPSDGTAYAVVHVHADRLRIEGHGTVPNRELPV